MHARYLRQPDEDQATELAKRFIRIRADTLELYNALADVRIKRTRGPNWELGNGKILVQPFKFVSQDLSELLTENEDPHTIDWAASYVVLWMTELNLYLEEASLYLTKAQRLKMAGGAGKGETSRKAKTSRVNVPRSGIEPRNRRERSADAESGDETDRTESECSRRSRDRNATDMTSEDEEYEQSGDIGDTAQSDSGILE
jgi:hypothetical protein